jgi:Spy/CpxP family protein refolding chaperone
MSVSKGTLLPALLSGIFLSTIPAFAQEEPSAGFEPPPPELAFSVALPITDLPESAALLGGDEMPVALPMGRAGGLECRGAKPIELSDEQFEKIHALKNQFLDAVGPKMVEIASKERKLRDALLNQNVDSAQAKSLQSDINALKAEVSNLKLDNKISCLNVLTPEQRKGIREKAFRWHGRGHGHGHEHFHEGPHTMGAG